MFISEKVVEFSLKGHLWSFASHVGNNSVVYAWMHVGDTFVSLAEMTKTPWKDLMESLCRSETDFPNEPLMLPTYGFYAMQKNSRRSKDSKIETKLKHTILESRVLHVDTSPSDD